MSNEDHFIVLVISGRESVRLAVVVIISVVLTVAADLSTVARQGALLPLRFLQPAADLHAPHDTMLFTRGLAHLSIAHIAVLVDPLAILDFVGITASRNIPRRFFRKDSTRQRLQLVEFLLYSWIYESWRLCKHLIQLPLLLLLL